VSSVIVVDSACCLPERIVNSRALAVLPLTVKLGQQKVRDAFTANDRLRMLSDGTLDIKKEVDTAPATREEIVDFLIKRIVPNYDFAIVQTITKTRSPQYDMWQEVNTSFAAEYRKYRKTDRTFTLRIMDSGAVFTGQGLMTLNTLHLGQQQLSRRELLEKSKQLFHNIQSYSAPVDLHYLRERARRKGDRTISFTAAHLGKALKISPVVFGGQGETQPVGKVKGHENAVNAIVKHAMAAMRQGLETPIISIAYSGPLEELSNYPIVDELKEMATEHGVKIATSVSSTTAIINMGPGTFSLAVAPSDTSFRLKME
jgi:DegV family protein with EDD domain